MQINALHNHCKAQAGNNEVTLERNSALWVAADN